jgi:hypothetical protein
MLRTLAEREALMDQLSLSSFRSELLKDSTRYRKHAPEARFILLRLRLAAAMAAAVTGWGLWKAKRPPDEAESEAASLLARTSAAESKIVAEKVAADPENLPALRKTAADLRKAGVSSRKKETLLTVLTWLVMLGLPAAIPMVPASDQAVVVNEVATVGLAIAITDHIRREKD